MRKLALLIPSVFILADCLAQSVQGLPDTNKREHFDIASYNKHQRNNSYQFDTKNAHVLQFSYADGYFEEITYPGKLFKLTKEFYKNGSLKQTGLSFIKGDFMKGTWQYHDTSGKLSHQINYDSWFKFSWDDVQHFLQANRVTIADLISINRTWKTGEKRIWTISYKTTPDKDGNFIRTYTLNGQTGKIENDKRTRPSKN